MIEWLQYAVAWTFVKTLATLPRHLATSEDRRVALDLLDRIEGELEATAEQRELVERLRQTLGSAEALTAVPAEPPAPHPIRRRQSA